MLDEEKVAGNEPEASATEPATEEVVKETAAKDPYEGKSADDLRTMLRDAQKQIGKQSTEIGEVRKIREEVESLKQSLTVRPRFDEGMNFQPPVQQAPPEDEFDYSNPKASIKKMLEAELNKERQRNFLTQRQQDALDAQTNFEKTKNEVYRSNPTLFKGIEGIVEGQLFQAYKAGAANKSMLADPEIWESAAILVRKKQGTLAEVYARPATVKPTQMDTPQTRRQVADDDEITFDSATRQWMKEQGISDEEGIRAVKNSREMAREGRII